MGCDILSSFFLVNFRHEALQRNLLRLH